MIKLDIDIGYNKSKPMYKDFTVEIEKGDIINIIGENGSGKSTFYKTLIGEIPPLKGILPNELKNNIAIVSDYINIPPEITVSDLIIFLDNIETMKLQYKEIYDVISNLMNIKISHLSSGQRRILEIFVVLSTGKKVIVLDEACNALDIKNRNIFLEQVKKLTNLGVIIFNTSHNLEDVVFLSGKVYILSKSEKRIILYNGVNSVESLSKFIVDCG